MDVSDDDVEQLGATLSSPNFKRLALRACPSVHDLSVSFIAATAPGLEALDLSGCVNISDAALAALLRAQEALFDAGAGRSRLAVSSSEAGGAASRPGTSGPDSSGADSSPSGGGGVDAGTSVEAASPATAGAAVSVESASPADSSGGSTEVHSERSPGAAADLTASASPAAHVPAPASPSSGLPPAGGTTAAAAALATPRPGLRSLRIAGCRRLTAEGLTALCSSRALRLRELSLSGLDDSLIAICLPVSAPRGGVGLSGAAGGALGRSTSDALSHAASGLRPSAARAAGSSAAFAHAEACAGFWSHIAHLELTQCGVSDEGLAHLLAACRNLRSLRLRWCPLLSERCLPPVLSCRTLTALRADACKRLGTAFAVAQRPAYPQVLITATA